MSGQQQTIKWGDILRIHGVSTIQDKQMKGLIISKGFTDPNVYYQTYEQYDEVNFYRESLFQILPKSNFDFHDQLLLDENLTLQMKDNLRQRAKEQISNFQQALERKHADKLHPQSIYVTYGSEVVFKHIESRSFLMGVLTAADIGEGAFKLQLAQDLSSYIIFNLVSHRSYQQLGNKIYYDDCLLIHHVKSNCYMNFPNTDISIIFDRPYEVAILQKQDPGYEYSENRPSIKKPVGRRISVINENKNKCLWKFIQHCKFQDSNAKQRIKSHDIVYFQHTKNKGLIASTLAQQKYYLKELADNNEESISYQCFWELVPKQGNQNGPQKCNFFWARNIVTGQILTYEGFKVQVVSKQEIQGGGFHNQSLVNLTCSKEELQNGLIKNYLLQKGENIPNNDKVDDVVKYFDSNIRKFDFRKVQQLTGDSFIICKVSDTTILDVSYVLSSQQIFVKVVEIISTQLKKKNSNPDMTWMDMFMSIDEDLLSSFISVLKLLSGKIYGTNYDNIEASGNSPIIQVQKILVETGIAQLIIQLIFNLYTPFLEILRNKDITEDRAIRLKISQIFELSYSLVQKIVKNFLQNKIFLSRWVRIFLDHSNNINKPFIQETLVNILQNNPVSIKSMINAEIIDGLIKNFFIEAEQSSGQLTTKHLRLFSTFIRGDNTIFKENQRLILNKFFLLEENQYTFKFKVEYKISDDQQNLSDEYRDKQRNKVVKLIFGKFDDPMTIPQFIAMFPNKSNYLLSYINLLADVCMDKNNEAIQYVQSVLPLAVVTNVLVDSQIHQLNKAIQRLKSATIQKPSVNQRATLTQTPKDIAGPSSNIHQPFIRIGHHAYVNNFKFSPIRRIRKIVKWYKEEQEDKYNTSQAEDITKTKRVYEGQKQQEQKTYLRSLLNYIKKFLLEKYDKDINHLQILHTVLQFLKETILLGLWDSIEQFREIVPLLINNITKIECGAFFQGYDEKAKSRYNGKDWVDNNKQNLKMDRPEINLIIQCKIKATQIFKYINEMELDIRLRYMMNFFQGIYDASQNFENYSQPIQQNLALQEITDQEQKQKIEERNSSAKKAFYKVFGSNILGNDINKLCEHQDMMLKPTIWYNKIKSMIPIAGQFLKSQEPDKDRNLFKNIQINDFNQIILSLFELSGYYNKNLINSSLNMLRVMFNQRHDLINCYNNILICGKGNLNEVYSNLKFMRNKFAMLENDIIMSYDGNANKSFPYAIFKPYDHLGRQQDKRSGIIQDLFFLSRTLKDKISLKNIESLMFVEKEVFDKNIVYHFYNQKERNNGLFQQLNMAEGIYDPLLSYIKIIGDKQLPQIHRWLLFSIYQYLTLLCFNNVKAKHLFMNYISYVIPHLDKRVGAASFLYEVCINNKILVNSEQLVSQIINGVLKSCKNLTGLEVCHELVSDAIKQDVRINNLYEKSRLLYCLRGILIFNDEGHKRNQQMLMNKLQDNEFRELIFNGSLKEFNAKKEEFNLNPSEAYATTNFELFGSLVQSQNLINIGKLQNLHPYTYCLKKLQETNRWQLRRALRSYVNRLYYVHKDRDIFLFEQFIRNQFNIINKELLDLIELHRSKMLTEELKVKNGIRFVYAQSEIILLIMEILITLHQIFLKTEFITLLKRQLAKEEKLEDNNKKLHPSMIKLLQNLGCIGKLYKTTKTIQSFVREIKKAMTKILLKTFHVRYLQKMSEPELQRKTQVNEQNQNEKEQQAKPRKYDQSKTFFTNLVDMIRYFKHQQTHKKLKEQYLTRKNQMDLSEEDLKQKHIDVIFSVPGQNLRPINSVKIKEQEQYHYKPHLQTAYSKILKVLAKPEFEQNEENLQLNSRLNFVKDLLIDSPIFKKLKEDEFYVLIKIFTKMDSQSSQIYAINWKQVSQDPRPVFSTKQIIKSIFALIIENPDKINDEQKKFIIKLARCYISQAVQGDQAYKLSVDQWNSDYYTDDFSGADILAEEKSQLVRRQHIIEQCGGSEFLLSIFKQNLFGKTDLLNQVLLFGIIYLFNGNTHCQNSILNNLKRDASNTTLQNIKQLIKNLGNFLIQVRKFKQNEKNRDFSYKIVDSYDHFDSKQNILVKMFGHKTDKFQIQTQLDYQKALCRIFRFLQLFCQNNNIEMKKFVMTQTDQGGIMKVNTINFITEATQLLRQLFKIMSSKVVNIPPSLLDFLNQITQIPCIDCQKSLMRSTFFEDISYMAGFFESVENIQQRKFNFFIQSKQKHPEEQGEQEQSDDPLVVLSNIYQKGIGLALSNFEGNDQQIYYEFLNKSQPKFLWIVIRQNLIKLLKPYASLYQVKRENVQAQLQNQYSQIKQMQKPEQFQERQKRFKKYKQFEVQYEFIRRIFEKFNEKAMVNFINIQKSLNKLFCGEILSIINVLAILKRLDDYATNKELLLRNLQQIKPQDSNQPFKAKSFKKQLIQYAERDRYPHIAQFINYFSDLILSIEVASHNGICNNVQNLYFPNHPVFSYLAGDTKDTIMMEVGRQTRRDKLITLFDHYQELQEEIQSNYKLKYYQFSLGYIKFPFQITSEYIDTIRKVARYISYLICALMLAFIMVDHDMEEQASYFSFFYSYERIIMRILTTLQLLATFLFMSLWIKMRLNLSLSKLKISQQAEAQQAAKEASGQQQQEVTQQNQKQSVIPEGYIDKIFYYAIKISTVFFSSSDKIKNYFSSIINFFVILFTTWFGFRHITKIIAFFLSPIYNLFRQILVCLHALNSYQSGFLAILVFVVAAIMGNFVGIQWYVIHLFDYFVGISLLTNVFKAVIDNIRQLSLLTAFATCFIMVFNVISLNTYTNVVYQDDLPEDACDSVVSCVMTLYTSGAIGDSMDQIYFGRFSFDMVYFIFMQILFSNLISGIMIDGFGALKEADQAREDDKKLNCYICALGKSDMQKTGTTFKKHTQKKHFLWNYMFYKYVLFLKDPSDYSGLQYNIRTQIDNQQIDWFPDNGPKDEGGQIESLMINIKQKIGKMNEDLQSMISNNTELVKSTTIVVKQAIDGLKKKQEPVAQVAEIGEAPIQ